MSLLKLPGQCDRCGVPGTTYMGSMFNTEMICYDCREKERSHPQYQLACLAERDAVRNGNLNYQGIGLPTELNPYINNETSNTISLHLK